MKNIQARNKEELIELHKEFNITLPEGTLKGDLVENLIDNGITNTTLRQWESKKDIKLPEDSTDYADEVQPHEGSDVVIKMSRANSYFGFNGYKFTKDNPFVVMHGDDAAELLASYPGFAKATKEEIRRFYR